MMPETPFAVAGSVNGMVGIREGSPANVQWLGFLESEALQDLYRRSRIVVVPSRWYEGFPNVVVQAMIHARPVVGARIGALTNVIAHEQTGLLFEPGSGTDLAEKLRGLYNDLRTCQKYGEAGRRTALAEYTPYSVYEKLIASYEKAGGLRMSRARE
jgi:glycosyltransferase involved in cell wall biosynthesis